MSRNVERTAWLGWIEACRRRLRREGNIQAAHVLDLLTRSFTEGSAAGLAPHVVAVISELAGFTPPWMESSGCPAAGRHVA